MLASRGRASEAGLWAGAGPCKGLTGRQRFLEDQSQGKGGGMYASFSSHLCGMKDVPMPFVLSLM